jgi:hypothetical protein
MTNLPVLTADDDFIEHLHEMSYVTIEVGELDLEWNNWALENLE